LLTFRADSVLPCAFDFLKEPRATFFANGERKLEFNASTRNLITTRNLIRWLES
jgi:hypothetical protein